MGDWTREETIIAFNLYCKIPFKSSRKTHPLVIEYAKIIGRTPSALNMKIGNIGRLAPSLREKRDNRTCPWLEKRAVDNFCVRVYHHQPKVQ
ncbi:MAG: hypothetical protein ACI4A8_06585 [Muribaculaceae bacterium]